MVVGSSYRTASGWDARARAMATERFMPVERSEGRRSSMPATPTISSIPRTICWIWSSARSWRSRRGKATFSPTVMESKSAPFWKTMVTLRRTACNCFSLNPQMSSPATMTLPLSALRKPMRIWRATDLPTPERPRMQRVSPGSTEKLTSSRTTRQYGEADVIKDDQAAEGFRDVLEGDVGAGLVAAVGYGLYIAFEH